MSVDQPPRPMLLSLGDSFSCGEGVGVRLDTACTWPGLLAEAMGAEHRVLAVAGATTAQVRAVQLPVALAHPPAFVTVLAGLNDVFRPGFSESRIRRDTHTLVTELCARHHGVLLLRLHDPSAILPLAGWVRRGVQARIAAVNDAIDAAARPGVAVLNLDRVGALHRREAWAVDRLHPSAFGHVAIAAAAGRVVASPWPEAEIQRVGEPVVPSVIAECRWLVRHGVPWVARRVRMLSGVVTTIVSENREGSPSWL